MKWHPSQFCDAWKGLNIRVSVFENIISQFRCYPVRWVVFPLVCSSYFSSIPSTFPLQRIFWMPLHTGERGFRRIRSIVKMPFMKILIS